MRAMRENRLAGETSPYLLQHAHNPVDWYPWGPEALGRARAEDRPIFLSIGYAACHWCHVMERESFEDEATARRLNDAFVPIKVDREERPDLDAVYMAALQAMTGQGGWPMSLFLTPDGRPFYGGTYFPSRRGLGLPAFVDVLGAVEDAWRSRRPQLEDTAGRLAAALRAAAEAGPDAGGDGGIRDRDPAAAEGLVEIAGLAAGAFAGSSEVRGATTDRAALDRAEAALVESADRANGGWGTAPKFPQVPILEFLLARAAAAPNGTAGEAGRRSALAVVERALRAMADGGIHDQVGGGFHRYSTDARWHVPHFEKMLYDNAQLARAYVHAWQLTGETAYARVAERTLDYLHRELMTADGLFATSQDADTDGVEGATYTWTRAELSAVLGDAADLVAGAFGVTDAGDLHGRSVLHRAADDETLAARHGLGVVEVRRRLDEAIERLARAREERPRPARDDKALAGWNGLAIAALAEGGRALDRPDDVRSATRVADAVLGLLCANGRLARSWRAGRRSGAAVLEDHALLADGLLALHAATFDERWFDAARALADTALARFVDPAGGFWDTPDDHERLVVRPRSEEDGAVPSGGASMTAVLLRLAALTGSARYRATAEDSLARVAPRAERYPSAFAAWLRAMDLASSPISEVAIVGDLDDPATSALVRVATDGLHPHRVVAVTPDPTHSRIELLQSRFALGGRATAFVCRDFACRQPVTEPEALAAQLVR